MNVIKNLIVSHLWISICPIIYRDYYRVGDDHNDDKGFTYFCIQHRSDFEAKLFASPANPFRKQWNLWISFSLHFIFLNSSLSDFYLLFLLKSLSSIWSTRWIILICLLLISIFLFGPIIISALISILSLCVL